ncbi:MAG: UDP-N-acetylmuramoyl-L-alanine--D-glutamate ligase, partial [Limisphaerales bacterium]
LTPAVWVDPELIQSVVRTELRVIGELELGFLQTQCLTIAIAGTNGKSTTAALLERVLASNHRQILVAGDQARPVCSIADQTKGLDFLILQANCFQLERTEFFRPAVAVLMNLAPDHLDRYAKPEDYARAGGRLFLNQQIFDWAVVQSEALAQLRRLDAPIHSKIITFSAADPAADIYLDRGLIISRVPNWAGPLLDTDHCQLRGPHNAENLMATLAVGHVLRLPLESMVDALKTFVPAAHRLQLVAEINGVQFINDSKAVNPDAMQKALLGVRPGPTGQPNVLLIAGGRDKGMEFHDVGPVLSKRVKRAFLLGEAADRIRSAWSLFTPCAIAGSLLEAVQQAALEAVCGDVVLLSPACSSFDQFRDYQQRGETFCLAVQSISRGACVVNPNIHGNVAAG